MANRYELELFVVGHSAKAERAESNLRRVCEARLAGRYDLRVTDVLEDAEAAEEANIIATPTLLRRAPLPVRMVVGDLSHRDALLRGLGLEDSDGDGDSGSDSDEVCSDE